MPTTIIALAERRLEIEKDEKTKSVIDRISSVCQAPIKTIKDKQQEELYSNVLGVVKSLKKELDERRKSYVDPLNKQVKAINAFFGELETPLKAKQAEAENVLIKWRFQEAEKEVEIQRRIERERERMQARVDKKGLDMEIPVLVMPKRETKVRTESGTTSVRKEWKVKEVKDIKSLAKAVADGQVPPDVLMPNMTALNRLVKAGVHEIPGVITHEDTILVTRSN